MNRWHQWWNHPEQELLKLELRRAVKFFRSWTGLMLIVAQLGIMFFLPRLQGRLSSSFGPAGPGTQVPLIVFISMTSGIFGLFAKSAIWIYLLFGRSYGRFRKEQREHLLMLPVSSRMIWPALLATPLVWLCIVALLSVGVFCYRNVPEWLTARSMGALYNGMTTGRMWLYFASSLAAIMLNLTVYVCLTFMASFVLVPKCSFVRFLWIFLTVFFLHHLLMGSSHWFVYYLRASVPAGQRFGMSLIQDVAFNVGFIVFWLMISAYYFRRLRRAETWRNIEEQLREAA